MKILLICCLFVSSAMAFDKTAKVRGFNLTELGNFKYDAYSLKSSQKTDAQKAVDEIYKLGATHVVLNPTATMINPRGNTLYPSTSKASFFKNSFLRIFCN